MNIKRTFTTAVLAITAHVTLSAYGCDPVIENNGFDLWCGEELCFWKLESGDIERVPTWHSSDFGVSFVGTDVRISQLQEFSSSQVECLRFSLVADVDLTADVVLQLDLYDDGVIDYEQPIPSTDWAPVEYQVNLPVLYRDVRFIVHKRGTGNAVIAQIYADDISGCTDAPLELSSLPSGALCNSGDECDSGLCTQDALPYGSSRTCGECVDDSDCGGQVCGAEQPDSSSMELYRACGAAARHGLGERCVSDAECATGLCYELVCSTCSATPDCPDGQSCSAHESDSNELFELWDAPTQCAPGEGLGLAGDHCLRDTDCASQSCAGTGDLSVCALDGRACDADIDCPGDLECLSVGTAGGTCD